MEFTVPQFIEYEAKIIGPLTFKQFIIVGAAGIVCFVLYLKAPLFLFLPLAIVIGGGALGLVFLKFGGRSPLVMLKNFTFYSISPKMYLWKRKIIPPKIVKREVKPKKEIEEPALKVVRKSRLKELSTKVETSKR
jgi:hypothetical protein